jgi:FMN reductase
MTTNEEAIFMNSLPVKIVGLGGSLRPRSYSQQLLSLTGDRLQALGASVEILDLRQLNLPFCNGEKDYSAYPDVEKLRQTVQQADGLILATPEYHGGASGVLKNALDLMSFDQLSGKVAGLISVLGGSANSNALNELRLVMRWVHAWVIPEQVAVGQAWRAFTDDGQLVDKDLSERLDRFAASLIDNARRLRA